MGCVGLSYDDFCRLRLGEFAAVCAAYTDAHTALVRDGWERTRILGALTVQPHTKKKITPQRLLPLPWDATPSRRKGGRAVAHGDHDRMAAAFAKFGDKYTAH